MKTSKPFNKTGANILLILLILLSTSILLYILWENKSYEFFDLMFTGTNITVIALLTFYLYKVNVRLTDITEAQFEANKELSEIMMKQIKMTENRNIRSLKTRTLKYKDAVRVLVFSTYPNLGVLDKLRMIKEAIQHRKDTGININPHHLTVNEHIDISMLPAESDVSKYQTIGLQNAGFDKNVQLVENIFNDSLPSNIKASLVIADAQKSYEVLREILTDYDITSYSTFFTNIISGVDRLEKIGIQVILKSPSNKKFTDIYLNHYDARSIYTMLKILDGSLDLILKRLDEELEIFKVQ